MTTSAKNSKKKIHLTVIPRAHMADAIALYQGSDKGGIKLPSKGDMRLHLSKAPQMLLQALMQTGIETDLQMKVMKYIVDDTSLMSHKIESARDAYKVLHAIGADRTSKPRLEYCLNGKWYPTIVGLEYRNGWFGSFLDVTVGFKVGDHVEQTGERLRDSFFYDELDHKIVRSLEEVLKKIGMRFATDASIQIFKKKVAKTDEMHKAVGKVMLVSTPVLAVGEYFWDDSLKTTALGTKSAPCRVIVEPELESKDDNDRYDHVQVYPLVRCFSLDMKRYVFVDIEDLVAYEFDRTATDRLIVPPDLREIITKVFTTPTEDLFSDMFAGRHGGMVILANGPSGVGKTLTAEVFAECTGRPLYVMEMGELGTSLNEVEGNLRRVFARAARWNAVLLFDEADVFMAERDQNLERNAIVAVFLRLLDYYKGMFFLTSNRGETIDDAFGSRITLSLDYPELSVEARAKIWSLQLKSAGLILDGDAHEISNTQVNGRQVRNIVRLLSVLAGPDRRVSLDDIRNLFKYTNKSKRARVVATSNGSAKSAALPS